MSALEVVTDWKNNSKRLSVGKPPLYKQGKCLVCEIPLFGKEDKDRDVCGSLYCQNKADRKRGHPDSQAG